MFPNCRPAPGIGRDLQAPWASRIPKSLKERIAARIVAIGRYEGHGDAGAMIVPRASQQNQGLRKELLVLDPAGNPAACDGLSSAHRSPVHRDCRNCRTVPRGCALPRYRWPQSPRASFPAGGNDSPGTPASCPNEPASRIRGRSRRRRIHRSARWTPGGNSGRIAGTGSFYP